MRSIGKPVTALFVSGVGSTLMISLLSVSAFAGPEKTASAAAKGTVASLDLRVPKHLLAEKRGRTGLLGWITDGRLWFSWFGGNPTDAPVRAGEFNPPVPSGWTTFVNPNNFTLPARSLALFPGNLHRDPRGPHLVDADSIGWPGDVAVGWRSPINGVVSVRASLAHVDKSDYVRIDGVEWWILRATRMRLQPFAHGTTAGTETKPIPIPEGRIEVEQGDMVSLVVGAKGNQINGDAMIVDYVVSEVGGGGRVWNLTSDVVGSIHAGNPHADGLGNADVWTFYLANLLDISPTVLPLALDYGPPANREPADVARSAYQYRADRKALANPPESWVSLMHYARIAPTDKVDPQAPAIKRVLCALTWEEVRPLRCIELSWPANAKRKPAPEDLVVSFLPSGLQSSWWNHKGIRQIESVHVSKDGLSYVYYVPDTWGVVVSLGPTLGSDASAYTCPTLRAYPRSHDAEPDAGDQRAPWKSADIQIEWGFDPSRAGNVYDGRIEVYDGVVSHVGPLVDDSGTEMDGPTAWRSSRESDGRRGLQMRVSYLGKSSVATVYDQDDFGACTREMADRTLVTVWTKAGAFTFNVADLESGPIWAPEYGFFVTRTDAKTSARGFIKALQARDLKTVRQRTRERAGEMTWEEAMAACGHTVLPAFPEPPYKPTMQVDVPSRQLVAQWNLGAWHLLRHCGKNPVTGRPWFNDYPYGIYAPETQLLLRALDLMGMHAQAADGLDQWLCLPMDPKPSGDQPHSYSLPDRPLGHFSEGHGSLTFAVGPNGTGNQMDGTSSIGPGAIMVPLIEHAWLTGDAAWTRAGAPRMTADVDWMLRQRRLMASIIPGGRRLWSAGLQPPSVVCPDTNNGGLHLQFYIVEAYYWLAVKRMGQLLSGIDPAEGARLAKEAEAYRKDLVSAVGRSIALSPVVRVRDGTFHSYIPIAPYIRGMASGAWSWTRSSMELPGYWWDSAMSAGALVDPGEVLPIGDVRVQGYLDVLEDRMLHAKGYLAGLTGSDAAEPWFGSGSYACHPGFERHPYLHMLSDDAPNVIRSVLLQYARCIQPQFGYVFGEGSSQGARDKIHEEAPFLERFRMMLVMEDGRNLWLARATPRVWLEEGKRISVRNAPTHFGTVSYEIVSDVSNGRISATISMPSRTQPESLLLRLRHPQGSPIKAVLVNGKRWPDFDAAKELVKLHGLKGKASVEVRY